MLEEKCGNGPDGHSVARPRRTFATPCRPCGSKSNISSAAAEQWTRVRTHPLPLSRKQRGDHAPSANGTGHISSREDAFRTMMQVADFFRRTEPHSPIPYLLEQAVRWGKMPLPELLNEMIPADPIPAQSFKLVGIRLPETERT